MIIIKLKTRQLEAGKMYLAYSDKSKKLSKWGRGGVFVRFERQSGDRTIVTTWATGKPTEVGIKDLDQRKDTFIIEVNNELLEGLSYRIGDHMGVVWPSFTPRMNGFKEQGAVCSYVSYLDPDARYPEDRIDGCGTITVKTPDEIDTHLSTAQVVIVNDLLSEVYTLEQLEERKRQEALVKVEAMKEGGIRLRLGKLDGEKLLANIQKRREFYYNEYIKPKEEGTDWPTAYFGSVNSDNGKDSYWVGSGACHAGLSNLIGHGDNKLIVSYVMYRQGYRNIEGEVADTWIDYLVNRSPWADAFLDKDVKRIQKYGFVLRMDAPTNALSAALTATRHLWEYPCRCAAFKLLRGRVENENLAFFISLMAAGDVRVDGSLSSLKWTDRAPEHTCIPHYRMSNLGVVAFSLGVLCNVNGDGTSHDSYHRPHSVWALHDPECKAGEYPDSNNDLCDNLRKMPTQSPDKKANPFDIPKTSVDKAIEFAVSEIESFSRVYGV